MYDQAYIDSRPTVPTNEVLKMNKKAKLALKHFKVSRGCGVCGCTMRTISESRWTIECTACLKQFQGLELPRKEASKRTKLLRGELVYKPKSMSVSKVNAIVNLARERERYAGRASNWRGNSTGI